MSRLRVVFACCASFILLLFANHAAAASLTVAWDPESGVAGFVVSYGTQSGVYTNSVNAGLQTSQQITGLADGTMYYFVVRAYDSAGTMSAPSFEVSGMTPGVPTAPPVIQCPTPVASSTTGNPVIVTFAPAVSGGTAPVTASCSPASGSLFPVGSTPTTCTATDALQLSASCTTSVVVTYNPPTTMPPSIMCPAPSGTSYDGKPIVLTFSSTVAGGTAPVSSTCVPASGSLFPVGSTPLNCTATDAKTLTASCSSTAVVTAATVPLAISCPSPSGTSTDGKPIVLTFSPTVSGGTAPVSSSCVPASGSLFPVGTTVLNCTAADAKMAVASCSSTAVVTSVVTQPAPLPTVQPLVISCPLIAPVESHSDKPVKVDFSPTVTGGAAPVSTSCIPASGSYFAVGTTAVTCTAIDALQTIDSCATLVTVTSTKGGSTPLPTGTPTELEGLVASLAGKCPAATFTIGTVKVTGASFTNYAKGSCQSLANGKKVHVQGLVQPDASVIATAITYVK